MSSLSPVSASLYRILVSDVLPYEHPVFFNNRYFARLLKGWSVYMDEGGNLHSNKDIKSERQKVQVNKFLTFIQKCGIEANKCFQYEIAKDDDTPKRNLRKLTLIHPYDQIRMAYFYKKYHSVIIDFCNRSHFSLRFPYKVATHHRKSKGYPRFITDDDVEIGPDEGLRHYFAYRRFKNINQFYGSFDFLNAERSYTCMLKLDVKHCFDNISPDLLAKALYDMSVDKCQQTVASDFSKLMRSFKADGDGIVIGPEFSRLFAEMVMQKIDFLVSTRMEAKGYRNKHEYSFYRYVDDGFLFYDNEVVRGEFESTYQNTLAEYGLTINTKPEKYKVYSHRPFLEGITAAKIKIRDLVKVTLEDRTMTIVGLLKADRDDIQSPLFLRYQSFITKVRSVVFEYGIHYKDIAAYTLAQLNFSLESLLRTYNNLLKEYVKAENFDTISDETQKIRDRYYEDFLKFSSDLIESLFFIVSSDLRMSTTIKVISIIGKIQLFVRGRFRFDNGVISGKFGIEQIDKIDQKVTLEISKLLKNSVVAKRYPLEALNLLEVEKIMAQRFKISSTILGDYVGAIKTLNFFTAFEILHFTRLDNQYESINGMVMEWLQPKLNKEPQNTEDCYCQLEFMSLYSYLSHDKQEKYKNITKNIDRDLLEFIKCQKHLFINWDKYDLFSELQNLNSQEVY